MSDSSQEELFSYYLDELQYLRRMGSAFADRYPKVAARLELGPDESADPHVERLLEGFAFLTARIRMNLDQQFPEIPTALLDVLYPQYLAPLPSATVAQFLVDPEQGKITAGHRVEPETPLFAESGDGHQVRMRTCYPVTLWPIEVTEAALEATDRYDFLDRRTDVASVIRIRLECKGGELGELELDRLRFYLNRDLRTASDLYELLFAHVRGVVVLPAEGGRTEIPPERLRPVGFAEDEQVFPYPPQAHAGYRLIQEYFHFPRKYLFADLEGLRGTLSGTVADLLILLDRQPARALAIDRETFALGCTPVVNLFRKTTEPIRVDHRRSEYRLVPDVRRERSTEIHTILQVSASADRDAVSSRLEPYYSYTHRMQGDDARAFWTARRLPTGRADVPGTEILLSFVDLAFDPTVPSSQTVYAHTLCTNRRLAEQLPAGGRLQMEQAAPIAGIRALHKPTPQQDPPAASEGRWRLVSHLALNHLSLSDEAGALDALKEILTLYSEGSAPAVRRQVAGLQSLRCRPVVRRMGSDAWRGFVRGTEVTVELDEEAFAGANAFVFASVLRHFLGLWASVSSFTQLVLLGARRTEEWKRWPPLAGSAELL